MEYGAYRRFALSLLLTSLGVQLLQAAILWQVYLLTGSALALGLTGLARAGPHIARGHRVGDIHERRARAAAEQDAFDLGDVRIGAAEVRQQRDERHAPR